MILPAALAVATLISAPAAPPKFEIQDGDRIVWVGGTLVEREQRYGYWEAALHMAFPDKQFTLRNLGWSGDTVFGDARAGFDNQAKGFERLVNLTLELKPTVIFVSYGANESFEGEAGLPKFEKGLEKLLDALKPANARVVLFSPPPVHPLETPASFPDPKARNAVLKDYSDTIRAVAGKRGFLFADLNRTVTSFFDSMKTIRQRSAERDPDAKSIDTMFRSTENGIHLTANGYMVTMGSFLGALGQEQIPIELVTNDKFSHIPEALVAKNQLFFYRWRPQNETYLFGFRKHEQGKNGKEVAEFDPLVAKAEEAIEKIRKTLK